MQMCFINYCQANYEVIGDHVTSGDCCTPMRSRQLHQSNEVC